MVTAAEAPEQDGRQGIKRREDPRLITGAGNFLDDVGCRG